MKYFHVSVQVFLSKPGSVNTPHLYPIAVADVISNVNKQTDRLLVMSSSVPEMAPVWTPYCLRPGYIKIYFPNCVFNCELLIFKRHQSQSNHYLHAISRGHNTYSRTGRPPAPAETSINITLRLLQGGQCDL